MLSQDACRARQHRLRERLAAAGVHAAAITDAREVYYLTGWQSPPLPLLLWIETNGPTLLLAGSADGAAAVDERAAYAWNLEGTNHPDWVRRLAEATGKRLSGSPQVSCLGWQAESMPHLLAQELAARVRPDRWHAVDSLLAQLERRKDADELELLRRSIQINLAAYRAAEAAIHAGVSELGVLAAGQRGAMLAANERVVHDGDYRSGAFNGPARARPIEAGELYVIDAQTCYRGYWSDLARTFSVGNAPTALQQSLYEHILAIQHEVPALLGPGIDGREVWRRLDARIRQHPALADAGLTHHGGHGIGLRVHELPDINRDRGGTFAAGDVVCVEPGGYTAQARFGVRIENTYVITEHGAVDLVGPVEDLSTPYGAGGL